MATKHTLMKFYKTTLILLKIYGHKWPSKVKVKQLCFVEQLVASQIITEIFVFKNKNFYSKQWSQIETVQKDINALQR